MSTHLRTAAAIAAGVFVAILLGYLGLVVFVLATIGIRLGADPKPVRATQYGILLALAGGAAAFGGRTATRVAGVVGRSSGYRNGRGWIYRWVIVSPSAKLVMPAKCRGAPISLPSRWSLTTMCGTLRVMRAKWHLRVGERGNNLGTIAPKHQGKRGSRADQKTRRVNKIDNPAVSAKPPSPVQIRAAPPKFLSLSSPFAHRSSVPVPDCP
jgi:hypothetical protein